MTASVPIAVCGAVAFIAIGAACAAIWRARATRAALRARDQEQGKSVELARTLEADSRLAGDVAHDLNDLLTAISGHAELLIANLDPSSTSLQDAREIRRAALTAARLTRPLRALSDGHRVPTDVIDVNVVAARSAKALQQMLGPNIPVTLALDQDIKRVQIAPHHLEEIVLNLGMRARDAVPHGGGLTVATARHTPDERDAESGATSEYVRIVVTDTSGGMSAGTQARPFEPLFVSDHTGGNAIGLAKVDAIVKQAGGRIRVNSAVAIGTTFTIDLPATPEPPTVPEGARTDTGPTGSVLVVEDEPGMRELIRLVLVRAGHEVVTVAGPRAALAALHHHPAIALMLVDVVMPEMDGYEVVAEARKLSPNVHVVFISAFAPDPARHPSGDDFLAKPFTSESLTSIVAHALSQNARSPAASPPRTIADVP